MSRRTHGVTVIGVGSVSFKGDNHLECCRIDSFEWLFKCAWEKMRTSPSPFIQIWESILWSWAPITLQDSVSSSDELLSLFIFFFAQEFRAGQSFNMVKHLSVKLSCFERNHAEKSPLYKNQRSNSSSTIGCIWYCSNHRQFQSTFLNHRFYGFPKKQTINNKLHYFRRVIDRSFRFLGGRLINYCLLECRSILVNRWIWFYSKYLHPIVRNSLTRIILPSNAFSSCWFLSSNASCARRMLLVVSKLGTVVECDPKAFFSIATTPKCRGWCYSFPGIAPLYPLIHTL